MQIILNGDEHDVAPSTSVGALVDDLRPAGRHGVAVAVNSAVLRRTRWDDVVLHDDDRVEVLVAVQGG